MSILSILSLEVSNKSGTYSVVIPDFKKKDSGEIREFILADNNGKAPSDKVIENALSEFENSENTTYSGGGYTFTVFEEKAEDEPKADEPKADEPKADEPKADEPPASDEPKADEPKADEPKADEPPASDEPPADIPVKPVYLVNGINVEKDSDLYNTLKAAGIITDETAPINGGIPDNNAGGIPDNNGSNIPPVNTADTSNKTAPKARANDPAWLEYKASVGRGKFVEIRGNRVLIPSKSGRDKEVLLSLIGKGLTINEFVRNILKKGINDSSAVNTAKTGLNLPNYWGFKFREYDDKERGKVRVLTFPDGSDVLETDKSFFG
jgi:hypothetical protein